MGGKVDDLVSGYIEELEGKRGKRGSKPVPFSMRLGEREHAKLLWLSEKLGVPKTPLAEQLLGAAVDEAVERYAAWASPGNPEALVEEASGDAERPPKKPGHGPPPQRPARP